MTPGQIVDYVIEYNNMMESSEKKKNGPKIRKATQADWDAFA